MVVGVNSTYRGEQLAQLVRHTDCEILVTASGPLPLLEGAGNPVPSGRLLVVDRPGYDEQAAAATLAPPRDAAEDELFLLIHVGIDGAAQSGQVHHRSFRPHRRGPGRP